MNRLNLTAISSLLAGVFLVSNAQFEATAIIVDNGIWLNRFPSGTQTKISNTSPGAVRFSPDGKRIAYTTNDQLYIMNNDGTDLSGALASNVGSRFGWSTGGFIWLRDAKIYRFVAESGNPPEVICNLLDVGDPCTKSLADQQCGPTTCCYEGYNADAGAHVSRDGRRVWARINMSSKDYPYFNCCPGGIRGSKPYVAFSPDFSDYKVYWGEAWGHGDGMTMDGYMTFNRMGEHHQELNPVHYFDYETGIMDVYCTNDQGGGCGWTSGGLNPNSLPMVEPPLPETADAGWGFGRCANKDSVLVTTADGSHVIYNWRTQPTIKYGEFSMGGGSFNEFWYGPLPTPTNEPYITLDEVDMVFVLEPAQTSATLQLTATNASVGQMQKLTADVSGGGSWLTATVDGSGGNTQTITVTATAAQMPADNAAATISVSGGGAANTAQCAVTAYRGEALPAPTSLTVAASGDSLLDALLSWVDNATNETGYLVERKDPTGTWEEVGRTGADATVYTDEHLAYATTYDYRLRAYRNLGIGVTQESSNSNESSVSIVGIEWIRVHRPRPNEYVLAGDFFTIQWSANLVDMVRVYLSTDGGRNWEDIHIDGGISSLDTDKWGHYSYQMPDIDISAAMIKVAKYEGGVDGFSGIFNISPVLVDPGLKARWGFEETGGSLATDLSGNGTDATLSGTYARVADSKEGASALSLTGGTMQAQVPGWAPQAFTIAFWINPASLSDYNQEIRGGNGWGTFNFHTSSNGGNLRRDRCE